MEDVLADATDNDLTKLAWIIKQLCTCGGVPPDPTRFGTEFEKVKRKKWKGPVVWNLKAKPTPYRLYLASPSEGELLFLHVLVKKRGKRPRGADDKAFNRLEKYCNGEGGAVELPLPSV